MDYFTLLNTMLIAHTHSKDNTTMKLYISSLTMARQHQAVRKPTAIAAIASLRDSHISNISIKILAWESHM
jgi:hypothetical protein